ncbi:MAG: hypothetical protein A2Y88_03615 [Chloroflexi bacterium RBG_13_48_10]|nr:MAG: hypothetical protein A2Y88_03615 [Chloroflexi bacterium RBG_13_48_10]
MYFSHDITILMSRLIVIAFMVFCYEQENLVRWFHLMKFSFINKDNMALWMSQVTNIIRG